MSKVQRYSQQFRDYGIVEDEFGDYCKYSELSVIKQKLEAAEARIKASQEQAPVAYVLSAEEAARTDGRTPVLYIGALPLGQKLYAAPVTPPDVVELQRENSKLREGVKTIPDWMQAVQELRRENAELTRKLADSDTLRRQYFSQMCEVIEKNDKLLAEAKSNAMPEGRKLLSARYVYSVLQQYYLDNRSARIDICSNDVYLILRAALSVAPQPETDRGSNE